MSLMGIEVNRQEDDNCGTEMNVLLLKWESSANHESVLNLITRAVGTGKSWTVNILWDLVRFYQTGP